MGNMIFYDSKCKEIEEITKTYKLIGKNKDYVINIFKKYTNYDIYNINFYKEPYYTTYEYRIHVKLDNNDLVESIYYQ